MGTKHFYMEGPSKVAEGNESDGDLNEILNDINKFVLTPIKSSSQVPDRLSSEDPRKIMIDVNSCFPPVDLRGRNPSQMLINPNVDMHFDISKLQQGINQLSTLQTSNPKTGKPQTGNPMPE